MTRPPPAGPALPATRHDRLDALRGLAIVWMAAYHLAFDLNLFGLIPKQDFYADPLWTLQRTAIVTLFLLCVGMGQAAAQQAGQRPRRFWTRWAQIAGCALLVSAGSALMFPRSWISFGVLHAVALMLLLLRPLARLPPAALLALAAAALLLPLAVQHPFFDGRATNWIGLVTRKPVTEDYVPLLPWFGVMLAAYVGGRALLARPAGAGRVLAGGVPGPLRPLARLGRWSLTVYMLHQPVFIGTLLALQALGWTPRPGG